MFEFENRHQRSPKLPGLMMDVSTITPQCKVEYFESSMDLCPLESFKGFSDRNSISPLAVSNRTVDECIHCNDRADYECAECTCQICGHKTKAAKRYRCVSCKKVFHEWCQNISDAPLMTDDWQCIDCQPKDIKPSEKDVESVYRRFTRSATINTKTVTTIRKMHNVARTSECIIVPPNHFGPIPNIPVGMCWEYRILVSEAGVHRPLVAGIHGRENEGAYSIVISGVYLDDLDNGDEFYYSGSGGKVKDPSKRVSAQIRNQSLTKQNRALALNCDCPLSEKGGKARNWRKGKPVRVIRNYKLAKFSKYAPTEGNRYDGIYKVVKYFPQKGQSGFMIWRYLLRRDDPNPAPWTAAGKKAIENLGLKMIKALPEDQVKYESTTFKIEYKEDDPMKKTIRRIRPKARDSLTPPPAKQNRLAELTYSTPQFVPKFKKERISPPPSPEPSIVFDEVLVRTHPESGVRKIESVVEKVENVVTKIESPNEMKPASLEEAAIKAPEFKDELPADTSASCFTQSIHIDSTYSLNMPSNDIISPFNRDKPYFPTNDVFASPKYIHFHQPEQPIMKLPMPSFPSTNDFAFKPIKLTKPKPIVMKPESVPEPPPIEDKPKPTPVVEKNSWELADDIKILMDKDVPNKAWWEMCIETLPRGKQSFMERVSQIFTCPCCHKITVEPVTLKCESKHSACLACLNHRFDIFRVRSCPSCQESFGPSTKLKVNENLSTILLSLFPDYNLNSSYLA